MTDGIIKGTGNSWNLKSVPNFLTLYPTYDALAQKIATDGIPIDLILAAAGWSTQGTPLNKANLLKDATAALYGKGAAAVPDDIFAAIQPALASAQNTANSRCQIAAGSYTGTGTYGSSNPSRLTFSFAPQFLFLTSNAEGSREEMFFISPVKVAYHGNFFMGSSQAVNNIVTVAWSGNSVSWYNSSNAASQMNTKDVAYRYVAIG